MAGFRSSFFAMAVVAVGIGFAQPVPAPPKPAGGGGGFANSFPQRPPGDPAAVASGKALYDANCAFCHGADLRGGDSGPNLLRSGLMLNDDKGEALAVVLREGRAAQGMPKFEFSPAQIQDIATFIHSFRVAGYDASRNRPASIVVGDAKAGETYFRAKCASCHSVTGDLAGLATRFADPRTLQQRWLMSNTGGRGANQPAQASVVVTLANGETVEGKLVRIDDYIVTLTDKNDLRRTFARKGNVPRVEIKDPLAPHKALLPVYTDTDIHNVTAYLVTLK